MNTDLFSYLLGPFLAMPAILQHFIRVFSAVLISLLP